MSGGTYDYCYSRVEQLGEDILEHLDNGEYYEENLEAKTKVREIANQLIKLSKLAKAVEWWASGDTSPKDFLETVKQIENE